MNALHRPWTDGTMEGYETRHAEDALALRGERAANDEVWSADVLPEIDAEHGNDAGALSFFVIGPAPFVLRMQRGQRRVTQARGMVKRIDEDHVVLGTPGVSSNEITLGYRLPASVDLRPLVGRRVCVTLDEEEPPSSARTRQTLTVRTLDGRVWLVARYGEVRDDSHSLGNAVVRVTLSPRDAGPLVVAPPDIQHIVVPGGEARVRVGTSRYVVELVSRDESGCAAYFIADDRLWH
jgi:hypothetical protein